MGTQNGDGVTRSRPAPGNLGGRPGDTRASVLFAGLAAVLLLAGGVVAGVLAARYEESASRSWWWWTLLIGTPVLCLGVLGVGTVAAIRWQQRRPGSSWPTSALSELPSRRERSALLRSLRRGDPIPVEQRDLALRVAREQSRLGWLLWFYPILIGVWVFDAVVRDGWDRLHYIGLSTAGVALYSYLMWFVRRMRARVRELEADT